MKPSAVIAVSMAILIGSCTPVFAQAHFRPPEVTSATDAQHPIRSNANGIVVLDLSLDEEGGVSGTKVTRDIPLLTPAAASSVQAWKFIPAVESGHHVMSQTRVVFAFRPPANFAAPPKFDAVSSSNDSGPTGDSSGYARNSRRGISSIPGTCGETGCRSGSDYDRSQWQRSRCSGRSWSGPFHSVCGE
jgi:hypothetical protein